MSRPTTTTDPHSPIIATGPTTLTTDPGCPWVGVTNVEGLSLACPIPCDCTPGTRDRVATVYPTDPSDIDRADDAPGHVAYPHTDRTLYDCPACERPCDGTDDDAHAGDHACVGQHDDNPPCYVCGDPIDYCQGHGTIAGTLPMVEISRTDYIPAQGWWDGTGADEEWEPVGDGTTERETFNSEWDTDDYGTPVVWAAARIRDLSADHNLEPSVYPLPSSLPAHVWLSATYVNPYVTERRETSARVYGVSDTDRAEVFRLAMLPGADWVAVLHAHRYGDR